MKLSYLLSIIIAIAFFSILYLGLDFSIIVSCIFAVIAYFASTMLFRENDDLNVEVKSATEYEMITIQAKDVIKKIELVGNKIDSSSSIRNNVTYIIEISNRILTSLKENPKKTKQVRKFVDYYLPFTLNILTQYNTVEDQGLTSKESKDFMEKVEIALERVKDAFEKQLNNMYETDLVNTNADIKVFETMLKTDGLVDEKMNIKVDGKEGE